MREGGSKTDKTGRHRDRERERKERTAVVSLCLSAHPYCTSSLPPSFFQSTPQAATIINNLLPPSAPARRRSQRLWILFQESALRDNRHPVIASQSGLATTAALKALGYNRKGGLPDRLFGLTTDDCRQSDFRRLDTDLYSPSCCLFPWGPGFIDCILFFPPSSSLLGSVIGSGQSIFW